MMNFSNFLLQNFLYHCFILWFVFKTCQILSWWKPWTFGHDVCFKNSFTSSVALTSYDLHQKIYVLSTIFVSFLMVFFVAFCYALYSIHNVSNSLAILWIQKHKLMTFTITSKLRRFFYIITYTWSSVTSSKKYIFSCYWLFWRCWNKILSRIISLNTYKLKTSYWNSLRLKIYSLESCQSFFSCKSIRCNFPLTVNDPSPVCDENIQQSSYCQALCVVDCRILEGSRDTIHR